MTDSQSSIQPAATRREHFKHLLGAGSVIAFPAYLRPAWAQQKSVVVVNSGGAMGDAKRRAIYDPFTKATGIEVVAIAGSDLAKMKIQVETKNVEWDVTDVLDAWLPSAIKLNLLEPIDKAIVTRQSTTVKQALSTHAVGGTIYGSGIAFTTTSRVPKTPKTWPDFWDTKNYPGRRGLRNRINDILEIALMADGVPPDQVYPCDVERAFKSLDKIKPHVKQWIGQTGQTVSMIQQNELDFTFTPTTRVKDMQAAGVPMGYSFQQNLLGVGWLGVLRGSRNRENAMRLLEFSLMPDRQVELSNLSGDAPSISEAINRVDPSVSKWLPDVSSKDNLFVDGDWWDGKLEPLTARFKEWLLT